MPPFAGGRESKLLTSARAPEGLSFAGWPFSCRGKVGNLVNPSGLPAPILAQLLRPTWAGFRRRHRGVLGRLGEGPCPRLIITTLSSMGCLMTSSSKTAQLKTSASMPASPQALNKWGRGQV
jgi:hypothetical protein